MLAFRPQTKRSCATTEIEKRALIGQDEVLEQQIRAVVEPSITEDTGQSHEAETTGLELRHPLVQLREGLSLAQLEAGELTMGTVRRLLDRAQSRELFRRRLDTCALLPDDDQRLGQSAGIGDQIVTTAPTLGQVDDGSLEIRARRASLGAREVDGTGRVEPARFARGSTQEGHARVVPEVAMGEQESRLGCRFVLAGFGLALHTGRAYAAHLPQTRRGL